MKFRLKEDASNDLLLFLLKQLNMMISHPAPKSPLEMVTEPSWPKSKRNMEAKAMIPLGKKPPLGNHHFAGFMLNFGSVFFMCLNAYVYSMCLFLPLHIWGSAGQCNWPLDFL